MSESKKSSVQDLVEKWNTALNTETHMGVPIWHGAKTSTPLAAILIEIYSYHNQLGYPARIFDTADDRIKQANDLATALFQEVAELQESWDWKPWRKTVNIPDIENIKIELVDILFFMCSVMEIFNITPSEFIKTFYDKLDENYDRIKRGYHDGND